MLAFHTIADSDKISYIWHLKNFCQTKKSLKLIGEFGKKGEWSDNHMYLAKNFISSFVYVVDFSKNYTSVRIDKNKKKTHLWLFHQTQI